MDANKSNNKTVDSSPKTVCLIDGTGKTTDFCCPRCENQPLEVGNIYKYQVCFCPQCLGFVIDSPTFGMMVNVLRAAYNGPEDKPVPIDPNQLHINVNCPTCLEEMATHPYYGPGNVVLDSCPGCVLSWLDNDELTAIMRAPGHR